MIAKNERKKCNKWMRKLRKINAEDMAGHAYDTEVLPEYELRKVIPLKT